MPDVAVQPIPHMDAEGLECFKETIGRSRGYLEYGSGGSTVYAANVAKVPRIISIESDKGWIDKVKAAIGASTSHLVLEHCDIGETAEWGNPKNRDKIDNYWQYMTLPWHLARKHNIVPDTILVDGRFRVASFLFSLLSARVGTTILFDDYFDRPPYFVAEEFCRLRERRGRMAVFSAQDSFMPAAICEKIARYSIMSGC